MTFHSRRFFLTILLLFFELVLANGCVQVSTPELAPGQAWLKPGVAVTLPQPRITPSFATQQLLTADFDGRQHALVVLLEADDKGLTLVGLSSLGVRLFKLMYNESGIHVEQSVALPQQMPPASQVLCDILLGYWPLASWQPLLPQGWTLVDLGPQQRVLRDECGDLVTEIDYVLNGLQREPVRVVQHAFAYEIRLKNVGEEK